MIQGQFWSFVSFDRRSIASDSAYTTRSGQISTNSSQASEKKKKLKRNTDTQAAASVAAPRVEPRWTLMWHPPSHVSAS